LLSQPATTTTCKAKAKAIDRIEFQIKIYPKINTSCGSRATLALHKRLREKLLKLILWKSLFNSKMQQQHEQGKFHPRVTTTAETKMCFMFAREISFCLCLKYHKESVDVCDSGNAMLASLEWHI